DCLMRSTPLPMDCTLAATYPPEDPIGRPMGRYVAPIAAATELSGEIADDAAGRVFAVRAAVSGTSFTCVPGNACAARATAVTTGLPVTGASDVVKAAGMLASTSAANCAVSVFVRPIPASTSALEIVAST